MLINERVQLIIKANGLSSSEFANAIGVKRSNLSHVLSGRNKPSLDFLEKVINAYPNVNASWLLTGQTRSGEFQEEETHKQDSPEQIVQNSDIEKIVFFFKDGSFKEYSPNQQ